MGYTSTLTNTLPISYIPLPSGNVGAVVFSATAGEIVTWVLLGALLWLHALQMWRAGRSV